MAYRGKSGEKLDRQIFRINAMVADGTVFQSEWSRQESYRKGMKINSFEVVIHNASDPEIFFPQQQKKLAGDKIKLIATSWSNNPGKGFDIYHHLDENLDFGRYDMTFIGRADRQFKNIKMINPVPSRKVAEYLRNHDIFIFASKLEACSNSLLEALRSDLPAVVRNTSSNPEILGKGGEVFTNEGDIKTKIDLVASNLKNYRKKIKLSTLNDIGEMYYSFCNMICEKALRRQCRPSSLKFVSLIKTKYLLKNSLQE